MNKCKDNLVNLVADIGGTNIRLAIAEGKCLNEVATYQCADFSSLAEVISHYIVAKELTQAKINACLAIACPADNDLVTMTNLPWQFSQKALKQALSLNQLTLINDYTAIAMAIPLLTEEQKQKVGGGQSIPNKPIAVCGPGTGLGVALIVPVGDSWHCISGEGGHVDYAPVDDIEIEILNFLKSLKQRVSYEQLLSGYGLEQIYQALCAIKSNAIDNNLSAKDISHRALHTDDAVCQQALSLFCKVLGSFAGNLALTAGALGGVYIAGGIVPRFIDFVKASDFRKRFEAKGRLSQLNQQTPTYIITESQPGLLGAAGYLHQANR